MATVAATAAGMGLTQMGSNQQGFSQGLGALGTLAGQFSSSGGIGGAGGSGLSQSYMNDLSMDAGNQIAAGGIY